MNRVPLEGAGELASTISDPAVGIDYKREAIFRLGELSRELRSRTDVPASNLHNPLLGVLQPQQTEGHFILRREACIALAKFSTLDGSEVIIEPLGRVLANSGEREEVRNAAAQALVRFQNHSAAAADQLIAALNKELDRGPQPENINVVTAIVNALGTLQDRRGFVPLMRVIQSAFPNHTKGRAQAALEAIRWS